jgi:hypothetical protein
VERTVRRRATRESGNRVAGARHPRGVTTRGPTLPPTRRRRHGFPRAGAGSRNGPVLAAVLGSDKVVLTRCDKTSGDFGHASRILGKTCRVAALSESRSRRAPPGARLRGAIEEHKAERLSRLEHRKHGAPTGWRATGGARLDLEVRQQVVHQHDEMLPGAIGGVGHGRDRVERQVVALGAPSGHNALQRCAWPGAPDLARRCLRPSSMSKRRRLANCIVDAILESARRGGVWTAVGD